MENDHAASGNYTPPKYASGFVPVDYYPDLGPPTYASGFVPVDYYPDLGPPTYASGFIPGDYNPDFDPTFFAYGIVPVDYYNPDYYNPDLDPPIYTLTTPFQNVNNSSNNFTSENFPRTQLYNRCGVPGVCDYSAVPFCLNITVAECEACNSTASGFFIFIILCLGLAIILGNLLVILVLAQHHKKRTATPIDWYKASLALADAITGEFRMQ